MKCYLTCPIEGTLVKISLDRSASDGRILGVRECSHLQKIGRHDCEEICVTYLNERVDRLAKQRGTNLASMQTSSSLDRESQTKEPQ